MCHLCHEEIDLTLSGLDDMGPTVDHIIAIANGGTNELHNLRSAHRSCNLTKGDRRPAVRQSRAW